MVFDCVIIKIYKLNKLIKKVQEKLNNYNKYEL